MIAYAIRRVLLIIPTLFAIMVVNFVIVQAAPGGPVEQMINFIFNAVNHPYVEFRDRIYNLTDCSK